MGKSKLCRTLQQEIFLRVVSSDAFLNSSKKEILNVIRYLSSDSFGKYCAKVEDVLYASQEQISQNWQAVFDTRKY